MIAISFKSSNTILLFIAAAMLSLSISMTTASAFVGGSNDAHKRWKYALSQSIYLEIGQTQQQVVNLLGRPTSTEASSLLKSFHYKFGGGSTVARIFVVYFDKDDSGKWRVSSWQSF